MGAKRLTALSGNFLLGEFFVRVMVMRRYFPKIKRWYFTLSAIWIVFWFLNIFFLIPTDPLEEIKVFFTDSDAFSIYWLWITAPILFYLIWLGISKAYVALKTRFAIVSHT